MRHSEQQETLMIDKGYIPLSEVAKRCGVYPSTIFRWMMKANVDCTRIGGRRYVSKEELKKARPDLSMLLE